MENKFQLLLYLIFGIIYVASRLLKNRGKQQDGHSMPEKSARNKPTVTFEDLLKEFTGEIKEPEVVVQPQSTNYEFERDIPSDDEIDEIYQKSLKEAQNFKETDSSKLRHDVQFNRFQEFENGSGESILDEIEEELSDVHSLKKAIIYKEILDRRY